VLDWTCKNLVLSAISSPHESAQVHILTIDQLIHERKATLCHALQGLTMGSAHTKGLLRVGSTRVSSGHASGQASAVLSCMSSIRNLKFFFSSATYPRVSSDCAHTPKPRLSSFIKIAVFEKRVERGASGTSGCVQGFHSANQINACVYSASWKHESKRGVCINMHRFNV